jgi:hypothetical protein
MTTADMRATVVNTTSSTAVSFSINLNIACILESGNRCSFEYF